jgi:hypothetical protein
MSTATFRPPAAQPTDLPAFLCARLKDPPKSEYTRREVMERVELQLADQTLYATTCDVGLHSVEVYTRKFIARQTPLRVRLSDGAFTWSKATVGRCVETVGGWKVELRFPSGPGGAC